MTYTPLGKFDSALHELLYTLTASWDWAQDHDGDTEGYGVYQWRMSLEREDLHDGQLAELAEEAGGIDPDDTDLPNQVFGNWIVSTTSQGFVYVSKFESEELLEHAWELFQHAYGEWAEANPDD